MNISETFQIPLNSIIQDFEKHLNLEYNKRILFSARFGAGKSTFLNDYFSKKEDDFIVLKLYPVNYAVASNEDVFELIKYDLFSELLAKYADKLEMTQEDYSTLLIAQSYTLTDLKIYPFIKALLKAAIPNGKEITEVIDAAKDIYNDFKSYQEKSKKGDTDVINDYINWCEKRTGSIYERDEITSLIADLITRVKLKLDNKKVILIIDDLDRLDPEHVFRLFNVFSAHYDAVTDINKFGLDKVIFVCDYNNIQLMYKHRYGEGVDFEGYINKFYSVNVFNFNTTDQFLESIQELLLKKPSEGDLRNIKSYSPFDFNNFLVQGLILLYGDLIKYKFITFRSSDQFKRYFIPIYNVKIDGKTFNASQFYFVTFINLVIQSISLTSLEDVLFQISNTENSYTISEYNQKSQRAYGWLIEQCLCLFLTGNQIVGNSNDSTSSILIDEFNYTFSLHYNHETGLTVPKLNMSQDTKYNVFKFMIEAIKAGRKHNLFK